MTLSQSPLFFGLYKTKQKKEEKKSKSNSMIGQAIFTESNIVKDTW